MGMRQWRDLLALQAAIERRAHPDEPVHRGVASRVFKRALANLRVQLKREFGPSYREVLNAPKVQAEPKSFEGIPVVPDLVREYLGPGATPPR